MRSNLIRSSVALFGLGIAACPVPPRPPPRPLVATDLPAPPVAIRNALVWTGSGKRHERGTVVVRDGKIAAVGDASVPIPPDATVVDASGRWVTPGIIDTHAHLGVYPAPHVIAHDDGNEATDPNTAHVSAEHAFWPQDPALTRAIAGGVTTMLVIPGSANLINGRGVVIKNRPGRSAASMRFPGAREMLKMACGENPKRIHGKERKVAPATRMANVAGYRQAFAQAKDYLEKWRRWRKSGRGSDEAPPSRDLKLETLAEVLEGKIWVQNHCYRADEMLIMLQVAREFGFKIRSFHHALEAYKIRDFLAKEEVAASTWADWWGFKMEAFDGIPENLALVAAAGARAVVHSDSPHGMQRLNQEAGKALAAGRAMGLTLTEDHALSWITVNPAWVLGIDDRVGTIEVGKMADLVIWSKHPLSVYTRAEMVFVDGHLLFDRTRPAPHTDFEVGIGAEDDR
jgi:imidazolonepropionase-like amidohydrolase